MNIREKAIAELTDKILNSEPRHSENFVKEALKRMSDPNLFDLYVQIFGHVIGETREIDLMNFRQRHPMWPDVEGTEVRS